MYTPTQFLSCISLWVDQKGDTVLSQEMNKNMIDGKKSKWP